MPSLRNVDDDGNLYVVWYQRSTATTPLTDVYGTYNISPITTAPPTSSVRITNTSTNWSGGTSNFVNRWGDYTTIYATAEYYFAGWTDGRQGVPRPFFFSHALP